MALVAHSYSSGCGQSSQDVCWVCLDDGTASDPLVQQWHCPRPVHAQCLARWQLHAAGSREETHCRFCDAQLPDWRKVLSPSCMLAGTRCLPTMSVTFNGQLHHIAVRSGPGGYQAFVNDIRNIFGITDECEMNLTFDCADPATGQLLKLNGAGAYNAAVHCAAVAASKRMPGFLPPAGPAALQPYPADAAATNGQLLVPVQDLSQLVPGLPAVPAAPASDAVAAMDTEMCCGDDLCLASSAAGRQDPLEAPLDTLPAFQWHRHPQQAAYDNQRQQQQQQPLSAYGSHAADLQPHAARPGACPSSPACGSSASPSLSDSFSSSSSGPPANSPASSGSSLQEQQALLQLVDRLRCIMDRSGLRPHVPEEDVEQLCCMQLRLRSMLDQAAPQC